MKGVLPSFTEYYSTSGGSGTSHRCPWIHLHPLQSPPYLLNPFHLLNPTFCPLVVLFMLLPIITFFFQSSSHFLPILFSCSSSDSVWSAPLTADRLPSESSPVSSYILSRSLHLRSLTLSINPTYALTPTLPPHSNPTLSFHSNPTSSLQPCPQFSL